MAKPNYSFEKRQREMAKRKKKEEKLREKAGRKIGADNNAGDDQDSNAGAEPSGSVAPVNPATST